MVKIIVEGKPGTGRGALLQLIFKALERESKVEILPEEFEKEFALKVIYHG